MGMTIPPDMTDAIVEVGVGNAINNFSILPNILALSAGMLSTFLEALPGGQSSHYPGIWTGYGMGQQCLPM